MSHLTEADIRAMADEHATIGTPWSHMAQRHGINRSKLIRLRDHYGITWDLPPPPPPPTPEEIKLRTQIRRAACAWLDQRGPWVHIARLVDWAAGVDELVEAVRSYAADIGLNLDAHGGA